MKLTASVLKGVWAGIPLFWNKDYSLDEKSFAANLNRLCQAKVHGIYTTGSTGEFYVQNFEEFKRMIDIFTETVLPSGIPNQAGCGSSDPRETFKRIEYAADRGVSGIQLVLPFWMETSDREVLQFFKDAAHAASPLPLIHYNIPRAKRFLFGPDYQRISEAVPSLIGVKFAFAGQNFGRLQEALLLTPQIAYFVAENLLVTAMQLGARGTYSSVVMMNPDVMLRMFFFAEERKWDKAIAMQQYVARFFIEMDGHLEKAALGSIDPVADKGFGIAAGFLAGHQRTRPPHIGWSDKELRSVRSWLKKNFPELLWK